MQDKVLQIAKFISQGKPILLFDFAEREAETDLVFYGPYVTHKEVTILRTKAGAPITAYLPFEFASLLNIPRITEVLGALREKYPVLSQLANDRRKHDPLFSFTLDSRKNRTGCSAEETAFTVQRLTFFVENYTVMTQEELRSKFVAEFKIPGHLPVIFCSKDLLKSRIGHAEMVLSLAEVAKVPKIAIASEMINLESGKSLDYEEAILFAKKHEIPFLEGKDVLEHFGIAIPKFQD
ncbi:MAG: 3,4-dihydroxy-2-butanone-4-phosphate synthase [Euryarchaeota archaeon]|nr:3,4-dihydroxy-2-butanone-4-phosphate synthase [Euryarchaeota archaeon]